MRHRVALLTAELEVEVPPVVREAVRKLSLLEALEEQGKQRGSPLTHGEVSLSSRPLQSDSRAHAVSG
jgi:hypothetical protein